MTVPTTTSRIHCALSILLVAFSFSASWAQLVGRPGASDRVGAALASGDFDGDGFMDLATGAPGETIGGIPHGAVHVVYGTADGLANARQQLWNIETLGVDQSEYSTELGEALAAGDFNGDGYDDLVIRGRGTNAFGPRGGIVYATYGSPDGLTRFFTGAQNWHLDRDDICFDNRPGRGDPCADGDSTVVQFGYALAAGDFNNDGFDELAIGIPGLSVYREGFATEYGMAGAVLVLASDARGLIAEDHEFFSQDNPEVLGDIVEAGDWFGSSLETGDINGDGFEDLAVGAIAEAVMHPVNGLLSNAGSVNLLFGSGNGLTELGNQFVVRMDSAGMNPVRSDLFGTSIAIGHFSTKPDDALPIADLVVGSPNSQPANQAPKPGAVSRFPGSQAGVEPDKFQLWTTQSGGIEDIPELTDRFGFAVENGDFNGDGYDELAIGQPGASSNVGNVFVLAGGPPAGLTSEDASRLSISGIEGGTITCIGGGYEPCGEKEEFGSSFAAGDFNNDGFVDLAIGAPNRDRYIRGNSGGLGQVDYHIVRAGAVTVLYGSAGGLLRDGYQTWYQNLPPNETEPVTPADNSELLVGGIDTPTSAQTPLAVVWEEGTDPDSTELTYTWQISSSEAFDDTLASFETGAANQFIITHGELGEILSVNGVEFEQTVDWYHRVVVSDGVEGTAGPAFSIRLTRGTFVGSETNELPQEAAILATYPNPVSSTVSIDVRIARPDILTVTLHDVRGAVARRSAIPGVSAGESSHQIDVSDLPGGVYFYSISGGGLHHSAKLVVLR